jgi:hypothetical protein
MVHAYPAAVPPVEYAVAVDRYLAEAELGAARMSYRRAAEIFSEWTRPLDPAGHGWTLHQLRPQHRMLVAGEPATVPSLRPARTR